MNLDKKILYNMVMKNNILKVKKALKKLEVGGYQGALNLVHENYRQDVKVDLSIWLNGLKMDSEITDYNILNMIRKMGRNEQWKHIRKLQSRGIIGQDLQYKVFQENNDFFMDRSKKESKRLSEDEIKDILFGAVKDFYKEKLKLHHEILFLHIVKQFSHQEIADCLQMSRGEIKYLVLSFKKNGLYEFLRAAIRRVLDGI